MTLPETLVTAADPGSAAAEAYRTLRTNLFYAFVDDPPKVILVTSASPLEGKSTTCANLGVVLAQADKSVLVLDCDLRKPGMHQAFAIRNVWGLVDVLIGKSDLKEVWQEPLEGLKVIPVGSIPPNPAELVNSGKFKNLVGRLRAEFDYVLIDAPPVEPVSDAVVLATRADGVLLVLDAQNTPRRALRRSLHSLETVGAKVLGTVMNNVKASAGGSYPYGIYGNSYVE